ncbi:MAG: PAS domain S-box protein [Dehalococcoidia bacterium]|nr:PAS domain S-box protein [Dehalococcoidia bacterium]
MKTEENKTKEQLIEELASLRQRVTELEASETQRKQAEQALQESEQTFRDLVENSPDGLIIADENVVHLYANKRAAEITGYSVDELVGMSGWELTRPDEVEMYKERMRKRLTCEPHPKHYERIYVRKDGTEVVTEFTTTVTKWKGKICPMATIRDITERKQAEQALQQSEQRFRQFFENEPEYCYMISLEGIILDMNKAALEALGHDKEELVGKPLQSIYAPESLPKMRQLFAKWQETGALADEEMTVMSKQGDRRTVLLSASMIRDSDGKAMHSVSLQKDITERKQAEEALRESEGRYRTIFETSGTAMLIAEEDRTISMINAEFEKLCGYSKDEVEGKKSWVEFIVKADLERMKEYHRLQMIDPKAAPPYYEFQSIDKHGNVKDIFINLALLPGTKKTVGSLADITERKHAEEALRQSEERYRAILESVEDGYFEVDIAGSFTFFNEALWRILGYPAEELMGMNSRTYSVGEDAKRVYEAFNEVYRTGKPVQGFSWQILRKDGSKRFLETSASLVRDPEGNPIGFRGVSRDVTGRKEAEEERRQLEQKAHLASRLASVGEMASGIAHEINNPLTGVIGYAQLLTGREDVPTDIKKDLATINDGAQRVADIVKRLLAFARQQKLERDYVSINDIIRTTLALRTYELKTGNIELTTYLAPDLPATIADGGQLQQVFLNLIINAETEMKLGHGKGTLLVKTETVDNTIRISFQDDGPGIRKENLDRIFEPFFTTREVGKGTGLGLSICYGIISEHGGSIHTESKLREGATFIVELPIVTKAEQLKLAEPDAEEAQRVAGVKILVVDDEPTILSFVSRALTDEGYKVETVDNATEALERIKSQRYNLILLDIKLPDMSGIELYQRIQKIARSLTRRVVFITGDVIGARTTAFLSSTKAPHIAKPFDATQLKKEINRMLREGRS